MKRPATAHELAVGTDFADFASIARQWDSILRDRMLPYWFRLTMSSSDGYQVFDNGQTWTTNGISPRGSIHMLRSWRESRELSHVRGLVSQTRMLWVFSLAHQLGYGSDTYDYLSAATHGYRYLTTTMLDKDRGGFYWKADVRLGPIETLKILYGQAFAIFALVEYYRASGQREALELALSVFETVHNACHDTHNSGWVEHCDANFKALSATGERLPGVPDIIGYKSGNAVLHWMEALIELYLVSKDQMVKNSLSESLEIMRTRFYSDDVVSSRELRQADWSELPDADEGKKISYGHLVEFAWLMIHAERALDRSPSWSHFQALLEYSLRLGFDNQRGSFYFRGLADRSVFDTDKIWWVQAEAVAALTDAITHRRSNTYETVLRSLIDWIFRYQVRSKDGIWIWSTDETGKPKNPTKAGQWKAAYHEVRAITRFIAAFNRPATGADQRTDARTSN